MSTKIGVIAEDKYDIDVLYVLTCKITAENKFSFKSFYGGGCGVLRRKSNAWSLNLIKKGCSHLVVIHDLDANNEHQLRDELETNVRDVGFEGYMILIPIQEIEAWLLSDSLALKQTFSMQKTPKVPASPELVNNPKEYLRNLVWKSCKKRYVNTIHNKKIAEATRIEKLSICSSFLPYPIFIENNLNN